MTIPTGMIQSEFRARFEDAVPHLPLDQVRELVSRGAPWGEMVDLVGRTAPWGFRLYWTKDVNPVVRLARDSSSAVAYLMGNHTIMERMFRYEPSVVMYAPLHLAIWSRSDGRRSSRSTSRVINSVVSRIRQSRLLETSWTRNWPPC